MKNQNVELENDVLSSIIKVNTNYIGNSNSLHKLGFESKKIENASSEQILNVLNLKGYDVIYTSGRCESNNLAIYGVMDSYSNVHNKMVACLSNCDSSIIDRIKTYENYIIIKNIEEINDISNISLICFGDINSYLDFINKYPSYDGHILYDASLNIIDIDKLVSVSFISFDLSEYNLYGIGVLLKKSNIKIIPLFKGGKSTTSYRSGTPAIPMIVGFSKYLRLLYKR